MDHVRHLRRDRGSGGARGGGDGARRGAAAVSGSAHTDGRRPAPPRTRRRMHHRSRARADRCAPARHHGSHDRRPAVPESRRQDLDGLQRRDLQCAGAATGSVGMGLSLPLSRRHRNDRSLLRAVRRGRRRAARGDVRPRGLGRDAAPARASARSCGRETAVLDRSGRRAPIRIRDPGTARVSRPTPPAESQGAVAVPRAGIRPGALHDVRRHSQVAARVSPHRRRRANRDSPVLERRRGGKPPLDLITPRRHDTA